MGRKKEYRKWKEVPRDARKNGGQSQEDSGNGDEELADEVEIEEAPEIKIKVFLWEFGQNDPKRFD